MSNWPEVPGAAQKYWGDYVRAINSSVQRINGINKQLTKLNKKSTKKSKTNLLNRLSTLNQNWKHKLYKLSAGPYITKNTKVEITGYPLKNSSNHRWSATNVTKEMSKLGNRLEKIW
jgi:hypothetical protein